MGVLHKIVILYLVAAVTAKSYLQLNSQKSEVQEYIASKRPEINPRYRLHYHVAPPVGWMNDPNGFSFYKGEYHLFYQFYPYDSVWGPMHWGHTSSPNLVDWKELPVALLPDQEQCFSGSAVVDGDDLVLIYTGHEILESGLTNQSQYIAFSNDGVNFEKYEGNPVIKSAPNGSPDFRDPKVWKYEDFWYMVIGSKTDDNLRGRVLLYRSSDLKNWEFKSVIGESNGDMGYMWECPDFFEMNGKYVFLMSPQGLQPQGDRYKNTHQTGYIIGSFDYDTLEFVPEVEFQEIDFGHDYYAAQTMEKDGDRLLIAWFGMWDVPHPEDVDGWAGAMTIVRKLELVGDKILQKPVNEMLQLRERPIYIGDLMNNQIIEMEKTGEIIISGDLSNNIEILIEGSNGGGQAWLKWDPEDKKVIVDRGSGDIRQVEWSPIDSQLWRIFLDASSLELFCGEGEVVFSSRVYPDGNWRLVNLSPQMLEVEAYHLKRSVPE